MAALPTQDRADITAEAQRTPECPGSLTKEQLRAVVDALDDYWEATGAAAANAAIPQPQRGLLTARQKAFLFQRVLERRYKVS
jgi:hypothetical protein